MPRLGNRNRLRLREAVRGPFLPSRCSGRQGDTKREAAGGQHQFLPLALLRSSRVTQNAKLSGGQKPCLPLALLGSSE